ncbi:MAG: HEPN domain-containing protein [Candidatus Methylomirabilales bacterium]
MSYEECKARGLVEMDVPDVPRGIAMMRRAQRDLKAAQAVGGTDGEWAYAIAAQAITRGAQAVLAVRGVRTKGREQGRTAIIVAMEYIERDPKTLGADLERIRKKGQHFLDRADRPISMYEVESALKAAEEFVRWAGQAVLACDPQPPLL